MILSIYILSTSHCGHYLTDILFADDFLLFEFIFNCLLGYFTITRLTREILQVRGELLLIRRDQASAAEVLRFYEHLGRIGPFVLVNLFFVFLFVISINITFALQPAYTFPFYSITVLTFPILGVIPLLFWYSGGKRAEQFAEEYESTVASGIAAERTEAGE